MSIEHVSITMPTEPVSITMPTEPQMPATVVATTSFLNYQVMHFYEYLKKSLYEWNEFYHKRTNDAWPAGIKALAGKEWKSFADYWSYSLYRDCGVKRRYHRYGDDLPIIEPETDESKYMTAFFGKSRGVLVQFFYDKDLSSYNPANPITQLCRHLVFDMNSMSIISLGVTKSLDPVVFEQFVGCNSDPANPENKLHVRVEEFLEGTMVVYNPALSKYKMTIMEDMLAEEDDQLAETPKTWALSTRKALGTSYFNNPGMSFQQMFDQNMESGGIDFGKVPLDYLMSHVFVFNVEHRENRVIHPEPQNRNTLVAVYKLNCSELASGELTTIMLEKYRAVCDEPTYIDAVKQMDMIRSAQLDVLDLDTVLAELAGFGVIMNRVTKHFDFSGAELVNSPAINAIMKGMGEYTPGVMISGPGGLRTKVRNPAYAELLTLKGNTPISINAKNKKNLFKLYWMLRRNGQDSIKKFLALFDTPEKAYSNIFDWYRNCIHALTHNLYIEYLTVFVEKKRNSSTIPYEFKPLTAELHKQFKETHLPTTKDKVIQLINKMDWNKVYWRIFGPDAEPVAQDS